MRILTTEKIWSGELIHTTKNGDKIVVEIHQQLIQDNSGKNIIIETNRDITERKTIEEKLLFQADILSRIQDGIVAVDENFNIIY